MTINNSTLQSTYTMKTYGMPKLSDLRAFVEHCKTEGVPESATVSVNASSSQRDSYVAMTVTKENK